MPLITPDTSEMIDTTPLPEGTYKAKVTAAEPKTSKKGNPMIVVKLEVTVPGQDKPRTRQAFLPISGEGAGGFDMILRACHFDDLAEKYKDPNVQPKPAFDTDQLINQELDLVIVPDLYQQLDAAGNPVGSPELRDKIKGYQKR